MRQIEIGLYINNILWVDDNIFNSDWQNKELIEIAYSKNNPPNIIPKISTHTTIAFLKSFKLFLKSGKIKYKIISNMIRKNEYPSDNAGARLVKYLQENGFEDLNIMIFSPSKENALKELQKLNVIINGKIEVTTKKSDVLNFLISN